MDFAPPYYIAAPSEISQPPPEIVDRQAYWLGERQKKLQAQQEALQQAEQIRAHFMQLNQMGIDEERRRQPDVNATDFPDEQAAIAEAQRRADSGIDNVRVHYPNEDQTLGQGFGQFAGEAGGVLNKTLGATVPGLPAAQSAVSTGLEKAVLPYPTDLIPGLDTRPIRQAAARLIGEAIVPTHVWDTALTLFPLTKARTPLELASGILLGDTGAIDALRNAGKKLGESEAVERGLAKLGEEQGILGFGTKPPPPPSPASTDPLDVLLNATTTEDPIQKSFVSRIVDQTKAVREYFGPAAKADRATSARVLQESKNIVVKYTGDIQQVIPREVGIEARALRKDLGETTRDQLRSVTGALDDFDDATRQRFLANLTPAQTAVYQNLRKSIDAMGDILVQRGLLDPEKRVENYFSHVLDFAEEGKAYQGGRPLRTPVPKAKNAIITGHRTQATFADDIVKGYKPVTLDPIKIYEQYMVEARTRLAMADIIDDIRKFDPDGVQFLKPGADVPHGFSTVRHPLFEGQVAISSQGEPRILRYRWAVRNNVAGYIKALVEPSAIRSSRVGRGALTTVAVAKRTVLGGPLDVNFLGFEAKAASYAVGSDVRKIMPGAMRTGLISQEGFDRFLQQEVSYMGRKIPRLEMWKRLDEAGLTAGSYRTEISRMLGDKETPTLIGLVPGVGKWYDRAQGIAESAQFDRMIPTLKHEAAALLVEKKLRGQNVLTDAVLAPVEREAVADINKAMGGLNRVAQGRSKTAQDLAALVAIAPDWLESRLLNYGSAVIPGAKNATARRFAARSMILGGISTAAGSAIYAHSRGWDEQQTARYVAQNLNPVQMRDGKPQINPHFMEFQLANGQWTSVLSWEKDAWRIMFGGYAYATGDREAGDLTLGNYLSSRLGTLPRLAKEAIHPVDYRGLPISKDGGWKGMGEWLEYEATQLMPSFAKEIGQAAVPDFPGGKQSIGGAIQNISGIGRARPLHPADTLDRSVQDEHIGRTEGGEYMHYRDLPTDIRGEFDKRHPQKVGALHQYRADRGRDTFDVIANETAEGLASLAPEAATDPALYRQHVGDLLGDQAIKSQQERKRLGLEGQKRSGDQGVLDGYYDAITPATDAKTHVVDFDKQDELSSGYRKTLSTEQQKRLDDMLGYSTDPTYKMLKAAKQTLLAGGYMTRRDKSFAEWRADLISDPKGDPQEQSAAEGWKSPDDLKHWIQQQLVKEKLPPEEYDIEPIWSKDWAKWYEDDNHIFLEDHPELDALAVQWGYQSRTHSDEADRIYTQRTGLDAPIGKN